MQISIDLGSSAARDLTFHCELKYFNIAMQHIKFDNEVTLLHHQWTHVHIFKHSQLANSDLCFISRT